MSKKKAVLKNEGKKPVSNEKKHGLEPNACYGTGPVRSYKELISRFIDFLEDKKTTGKNRYKYVAIVMAAGERYMYCLTAGSPTYKQTIGRSSSTKR